MLYFKDLEDLDIKLQNGNCNVGSSKRNNKQNLTNTICRCLFVQQLLPKPLVPHTHYLLKKYKKIKNLKNNKKNKQDLTMNNKIRIINLKRNNHGNILINIMPLQEPVHNKCLWQIKVANFVKQ